VNDSTASQYSGLTTENLTRILRTAVADLWLERGELLERRVNERTVTHRLAVHLERHFPSHEVDCEYNKNGRGAKRLSPAIPLSYPDIVVHQRGTNAANLLVIELKYMGDRRGSTGDSAKLKLLSDQVGEYRYQLAVFIEINELLARLTTFQNAQESGSEQLIRQLNGPDPIGHQLSAPRGD
jgi:hypothetical protein